MARAIEKRGKNVIRYTDGCLRIDNLIASYPHVDEPWAKNEKDKPKFSITGLGDKETHAEAKKFCVEIIDELLAEKKMGKIGAEHKFIRNGDDSGKDENEGRWIIKASENANRRPPVRDQRGNLIDQKKIADTIYPGCIVNILIRPWAQNNEHGKKINANLIGVQFVRDGERLGEAPIDDEDAWDEIPVADDEFGDDDDL